MLSQSSVAMGMMERGAPYKVVPTSCPRQHDQYVEIPQAEQLNEVCISIALPPPPTYSGSASCPEHGGEAGGGGGGGDQPRRCSSTSSASTMTAGGDVCRICHCESEPDAPLISPCVCAGSLKYVHQACLQQWIKSADTKSCELCKYHFTMTTKIKPFRKWQKLEMSTVERRKMMCSVTFHIIAITCVVWSLYVLIDRTTEEVKNGILEWPFWTKLIVVAIGFTGGLVFMYVQCKMYVQLCRRWRAYNRVIFIQNCPEGRPLQRLGGGGGGRGGGTVPAATEKHTTIDTNQNGIQETEVF